MTKRILIAFAFIAGLLVTSSPAEVQAQELQITGPLAGAPACRQCRLYRAGRFQIAPQVGFTLQDEYARAIILGATLQYNITEWIGIGIWGGYNPVDIDTDLTTQVKANGQTTERNVLSLPNAAEFGNQIARFRAAAALQLTFIPLRGKLSLFQEVFIDTDFYVSAGAALVFVEQRGSETGVPISLAARGMTGCNTNATTTPDVRTNACGQLERENLIDFTFTIAVGLNMYVTDFFSLSFEWRALPFAWNTSGTDEKNQDGETFPDGTIDGNDNIYRLNHMVNIGLNFFLPTAAGVSE